MGVSARLIDCSITHKRFTPKVHEFKSSFFWFELDIDQLDKDFSHLSLVSRNKFNVFEFRDADHMDFGHQYVRQNVEHFLRINGEEQKPKSIRLWTHLRFMGYVFNPVSFYLLEMPDNSKRIIMEVGNTFNELKPFLVPGNSFKNDTVEISVPKHFYVSPFIALDTIFTFRLRFSDEAISLSVLSDSKQGQRILAAGLQGKFLELSNYSLFKKTLKYPFVTLKVIALIHWHALLLWLKRIPYISKNDNPELQQGNMVWKK